MDKSFLLKKGFLISKWYAERMDPSLFGCIKAGNKTANAVGNYGCFE